MLYNESILPEYPSDVPSTSATAHLITSLGPWRHCDTKPWFPERVWVLPPNLLGNCGNWMFIPPKRCNMIAGTNPRLQTKQWSQHLHSNPAAKGLARRCKAEANRPEPRHRMQQGPGAGSQLHLPKCQPLSTAVKLFSKTLPFLHPWWRSQRNLAKWPRSRLRFNCL